MSIKARFVAAKVLARALSDSHTRRSLFRAIAAERRQPPAECSCCGYVGRFQPAGLNARIGQLCPSCRSYERHRLVALAFQRRFLDLTGKDVVHFAPEQAIRPLVL